ncbi:Radical SAM domain protein [Desulfurispirillum indicum S5]|uniref:Radical SAM domain protein n=1 Tax=Desulfurispirillum indicum (strain ATCC BAA-1389 / DSM 22839 / S5) TaxID=653733 RepID=E6W3Y5_DESIS|nr:radical SAM protein [Desulfurispirillum indicum]ADU65853.1 Radical SAM domain protein [Desulfurispirillum indicum S5]
MVRCQYLFGPVRSRRLGMSLGIDLLPHKTCSEDCIYCECGATTRLTTTRQEFVPMEAVLHELRHLLATKPQLDVITFAGSGEPLLFRRFGELVAAIKAEFPQYRLCLLTNGTPLTDRALWQECQQLDIVVPSLDAATQEIFTRINRPHHTIDVQEVITALSDFSRQFCGEIWLEILILPGINDDPAHLEALAAACRSIDHTRIQLGTMDRPGTQSGLVKASAEYLHSLAARFFPGAEVVTRPDTPAPGTPPALQAEEDIAAAICRVLQVRPSTAQDLYTTISSGNTTAIDKALSELLEKKLITRDEDFYRWCR